MTRNRKDSMVLEVKITKETTMFNQGFTRMLELVNENVNAVHQNNVCGITPRSACESIPRMTSDALALEEEF